MHLKLAEALIDKGVIRQHTELEARYRAADLGGNLLTSTLGTFMIVRAFISPGKIIFEAASTVDGRRRRIDSTEVTRIDGMDLGRLAAIYNLTADGEPLKAGRRRGRKPKLKPLTQVAQEAQAKLTA